MEKKEARKIEFSESITETTYMTLIEKSYFGLNGYTIPKTCFTEAELKKTKDELSLLPIDCSKFLGIASSSDEEKIIIYRENADKLYVPRFFGMQKWGIPKRSQLSLGESTRLDFQGTMLPFQTEIVDKFMRHIHPVERPVITPTGGVIEVPCGKGKTVMALKLISLIGQKTLIIVNKGCLADQWLERINQFIPNARVGRIQASTLVVEDKDIVIGMLQTLFSKDYNKQLYASFGFLVVDEVHRIGSRQFSKALINVSSIPITLGISATVNRKDGLTPILFHFLGPMIHSVKREQEDEVLVRTVLYDGGDAEFNVTETDHRGNIKYSTMISKVCNYVPRTVAIVRLLSDLIAENPAQQILVLGHNISLLRLIHELVETQGFATAGFYIGGMKEAQLNVSKTRQIVIGSYAMASEGLDIRDLATLVMASPKTEIEQVVGRILRIQHEQPMIIDVVDTHQVFKSQSKKREQFYKRLNYKIVKTSFSKYCEVPEVWA